MSEASGHGTVMATSGISPDDPASTKILGELNLLAIHGMVIRCKINLNPTLKRFYE